MQIAFVRFASNRGEHASAPLLSESAL